MQRLRVLLETGVGHEPLNPSRGIGLLQPLVQRVQFLQRVATHPQLVQGTGSLHCLEFKENPPVLDKLLWHPRAPPSFGSSGMGLLLRSPATPHKPFVRSGPALKPEPLLTRQEKKTERGRKTASPKSARSSSPPINTRDQLAKAAGVARPGVGGGRRRVRE